MLMFSIANEGSIYHWVRDHRVHHKNSETEADPHNVRNEYINPKSYIQITTLNDENKILQNEIHVLPTICNDND